jgi:hypothetical protein
MPWWGQDVNLHQRHHPGIYARFRHWLITFHDSTLEVLAQDAKVLETSSLPPDKAVIELRAEQAD